MSSSGSRNELFTRKELRERGFAMRDAPLALLVYDPAADGDDHDGLIILSREEHRRGELHDPDLAVEMIYRVLMAQYMPRELEFQDKAAKILSLHRSMRAWTNRGKMAEHMVLVETNGVGWPMQSFLKDKLGFRLRPYTTTSTLIGRPSGAPHQSKMWAMPRLAALDHLRMQMDLQRLKTEEDAPGASLLIKEFNSFIWASKNRPEAIQGQHDDLIMPLAAGCWFGSKVIPPLVKATRVTASGIGAKSRSSNSRVRLQ